MSPYLVLFLTLDICRFALILIPAYEDESQRTPGAGIGVGGDGGEACSWQWLATVNRVNAQVMKVRALMTPSRGCGLTVLIDAHTCLCDGPETRSTRGLTRTRAIKVLQCTRGDRTKVHPGQDARVRKT